MSLFPEISIIPSLFANLSELSQVDGETLIVFLHGGGEAWERGEGGSRVCSPA